MAPKKSQIWTYFSDETDGQVKCLYCRQILSVKNKSTSTLIRHIMKHIHLTEPISWQTVEPFLDEISTSTQQSPPIASSTSAESEVLEENELDVGLLIDTIQKYEYLYNTNHTSYKDRKKKNLAWKEIAMILNTTVEKCQKQWKALRNKFFKEKKKTGSGVLKSEWIYFNQMMFYTKYRKLRKTYCPTELLIKTECNESQPLLPTTSIEEGEVDATTLRTSTGKAVTKKRKSDLDNEGVEEVAKKICSTLTGTNVNKGNTNSKFAEYVCARLEEMSPEEAKQKRKKMLLILEQ